MYTLTIICWVIALVLLARITWWLVAPAPVANSVSVSAQPTSAASNSEVNLNKLLALNLFGAEQSRQQQLSSAPKTTLNVRLVGVAASNVPERSAAIIQQGAAQETYIVGDRLSNSSVKIAEIYADRVILDNGGRLETLQLEDVGEDRPALALTVDEQTDSTTAQQGSVEGAVQATRIEAVDDQATQQQLREIQQNPANLFNYLSISPVRENGNLIGYRLSPGSDPSLFKQVGLESGDLAVAINGYDLTDMSQAMLATEELQNSEHALIEIERNGERLEIDFSLSQKRER
ncbi:type II secretion system protein GspC [Idiomarina tyrosinivorans]|uniref:Type II secretion system protein GspC n=2 Tax=Idiomarina tyrosinivorans TaxID=1445662 RepID=A0A432ZR24_9GAMM|nr:type II secretion system protein GspC [Idiomarina tyrosinivorans]